uniref:Uncharacterized protein n=1 Tax=Meloidogyne incognita TaxID=6306 RepID=A0A914MBN0_MELIC
MLIFWVLDLYSACSVARNHIYPSVFVYKLYSYIHSHDGHLTFFQCLPILYPPL